MKWRTRRRCICSCAVILALSSSHRASGSKVLAFSGGFAKSSNTRSTRTTSKKRKREIPKDLVPANELQVDQWPELDKWGLPTPTVDDIFPPLPPGTELIVATKGTYSMEEIRDALKDHIPILLNRFDAHGVESNPSPGRQPMKLGLLHQSPPVLAIENYFSPEECLRIQQVAVPPIHQDSGTQRPVQIDSKTFSPLSQSKRTSTSWFCYYSQVPVLLSKTYHVLGIPTERMEEPQIVRYRPGQEFSWHYDEVPPPQLGNGGQRLATLLVYLTTVSSGGGTIFRDLQDRNNNPLAVKPVQGLALLFFPAFANGRVDDRTLHKGEAAGDEKWIVQMWIHQSAYRAAVPPDNRQGDAWSAMEQVSRDLGYVPRE